jgi:vacuolar-type H+-ATPase subunit H
MESPAWPGLYGGDRQLAQRAVLVGTPPRIHLGKVKAMPDQSSASTEHAIMQQITAPLATLPDDPVPVAADVDFPIVLRGYDRIAVDAYVKKTSQLVAELQATRSPEAAVRRALERVGDEVSGILQRAHETASQITTQSRSEAEDRLEEARREAQELTAEASDRVKELDLETDRIWEERLRIVEDARELARQLLALADSAAQRFPAEETESTDSAAPAVAAVFSDAGADEPAAEEAPGSVQPLDVESLAAPGAAEAEPLAEEPLAAEPLAAEPLAAEPLAAEPLAGEPHPDPVAAPEAGPEPDAEEDEEDDPDRASTAIMPPIRPPEPGEQSR